MLLGCMLKWRSQLFRKWKPLRNHRRHIIDPPHRVNLTSFCPSATPALLGPPPPSSSIRPWCPRMERGGVVAVATTKISGSIPVDASVATPIPLPPPHFGILEMPLLLPHLMLIESSSLPLLRVGWELLFNYSDLKRRIRIWILEPF